MLYFSIVDDYIYLSTSAIKVDFKQRLISPIVQYKCRLFYFIFQNLTFLLMKGLTYDKRKLDLCLGHVM